MPTITFANNGQSYEVPEGTSFLEFCQANGVEFDFGCTVGSCGTCRMQILEGADNVDPADDEEKETIEMCTDVEGARLGCGVVIRGDVKLQQLTD